MSHPDRTLAFQLLILLISVNLLPRVVQAEIAVDADLEIRVLLDNSGSMYPGYAPPGREGLTRARAGGLYYAQYPEFAGWVNDFVAAQTILGGRSVSLSTFTSTGAFEPSDVRTLVGPSPLALFEFANVQDDLPARGKHTYLSESLRQATRGFEGVLWMITDNIVEDRRGVPDQGVQRFFQSLAGGERYRAVHLYKLPFSRLVAGKPGHLAIYGVLVSDTKVEPSTLRYFDNKFRGDFLRAGRRSSPGPLFPDEAYWKLKDLSVGALELEMRPTLQVEILQRERQLFRERTQVRLRLDGSVSSRLTQHRITGGHFEVVPLGPFVPRTAEGDEFGRDSVPREHFDGSRSSLPSIPPRDSARIEAQLQSNRPIPLETSGLRAWLRSASRGVEVTFTGQVEARFSGLVAEFERDQMDGIFGADAAPEIFRIPSRIEIPREISNPQPISFTLSSGYGRQMLFVLLLLLALVLSSVTYFVFARSASYRVRIAGSEQILTLRRFGSRPIEHFGFSLGRLARNIAGTATFAPNTRSVAFSVRPTDTGGRFEVSLRDQPSEQLEIREVGGGPVALATPRSSTERAGARAGGVARGGQVSRPGGRDSRPILASARATSSSRPGPVSPTSSDSTSPKPGGSRPSRRFAGRPKIQRPR